MNVLLHVVLVVPGYIFLLCCCSYLSKAKYNVCIFSWFFSTFFELLHCFFSIPIYSHPFTVILGNKNVIHFGLEMGIRFSFFTVFFSFQNSRSSATSMFPVDIGCFYYHFRARKTTMTEYIWDFVEQSRLEWRKAYYYW